MRHLALIAVKIRMECQDAGRKPQGTVTQTPLSEETEASTGPPRKKSAEGLRYLLVPSPMQKC